VPAHLLHLAIPIKLNQCPASDCFETLYSIGELSPQFGGSQPVIVAFERDGELLGPGEGMARIINPGDKRGGRRIFNIARIRVFSRPAPLQ
jgi:hypothetical protein